MFDELIAFRLLNAVCFAFTAFVTGRIMAQANIIEATVDRLSASDIARQLNVNPCVPNRWMTKGLSGQKLHSFFIGGRRYTTQQDLDEFHQRVNATKAAAATATAEQASAVQAKASGRTDARARRFGNMIKAQGG